MPVVKKRSEANSSEFIGGVLYPNDMVCSGTKREKRLAVKIKKRRRNEIEIVGAIARRVDK